MHHMHESIRGSRGIFSLKAKNINTSPMKVQMGADAAMAPSRTWGYFIRIHAAYIPPGPIQIPFHLISSPISESQQFCLAFLNDSSLTQRSSKPNHSTVMGRVFIFECIQYFNIISNGLLSCEVAIVICIILPKWLGLPIIPTVHSNKFYIEYINYHTQFRSWILSRGMLGIVTQERPLDFDSMTIPVFHEQYECPKLRGWFPHEACSIQIPVKQHNFTNPYECN